jgi:hypothetical protein
MTKALKVLANTAIYAFFITSAIIGAAIVGMGVGCITWLGGLAFNFASFWRM